MVAPETADAEPAVDVDENLEDVVDELQENLERLEELMGENVKGLHARLSKLEDRLDGLDHQIDSIESQAKAAAASSSPKKEGKIEKALDVLEAADRKVGGQKGVKNDNRGGPLRRRVLPIASSGVDGRDGRRDPRRRNGDARRAEPEGRPAPGRRAGPRGPRGRAPGGLGRMTRSYLATWDQRCALSDVDGGLSRVDRPPPKLDRV